MCRCGPQAFEMRKSDFIPLSSVSGNVLLSWHPDMFNLKLHFLMPHVMSNLPLHSGVDLEDNRCHEFGDLGSHGPRSLSSAGCRLALVCKTPCAMMCWSVGYLKMLALRPVISNTQVYLTHPNGMFGPGYIDDLDDIVWPCITT